MKILWVKAGKLLPLDAGGRIRSYNILKPLAEQHDLTFLSYYTGRHDLEYDAEIRSRFPGAITFCDSGLANATIRDAVSYILNLPCFLPFAVSKFTSQEVRKNLEDWFRARRFDVAVCDFLSASQTFPAKSEVPTVLFQHNVETALWQRQAYWETNWLKKLVFKLEAEKMRRYESAALGNFDHIIAVSDHDRDLFCRMVDPQRISTVPTGVDLHLPPPSGSVKSTPGLVVFVGSMDWEPNVDAVEYFCSDVWPRVIGKSPSARFRIVGRNPHPRVKRLASPSVEVTGTVSSVVDHLQQAEVFVVPLRAGGGTRLKIYEAMAMSKAVVSSSVGAEGLDVEHGQNIYLADDASAFADAVVMLLNDPELRRRYGTAAAEEAKRHDWAAVTSRFIDVLRAVVQSAGVDDFRMAVRSSGSA